MLDHVGRCDLVVVVGRVKAAVAAGKRTKVGAVVADLDGGHERNDNLRTIAFDLGGDDPGPSGVQVTEHIPEEPCRNRHGELAHRLERERPRSTERVVERERPGLFEARL